MIYVLTVCGALYWACFAFWLLRGSRSAPAIRALRAPPPPRWPRVSIVVPARDESSTLEGALRAKLEDAYPDLEVVLVDDRSTDDTGAMADAFARADPRVQVVHIEHLPDGWLGKVHAMQRGLERASGEWILFSDADVHLAPGTLERVVAHAEHAGIDHVAVLPRVRCSGPVLVPTLTTFFRLTCAAGRLWAVPDPRSSAAVGIGAFNLVRRAALARSPGLEWLKMEIGDDVALGVMLKRSGARQAVLTGRSEVDLQFYPSFPALARAVEKNGASAPLPLLLLGALILLPLEWSPVVALLSGSLPLALAGAGLWGGGGIVAYGAARWLGLPRWPALVPFLGVLPLAWAMVRSGMLAVVRRGVVWRGTYYPMHVVRAGGRLRPSGVADLPATRGDGALAPR